MVHYATLGIDRRWKRRIISLIPPDAKRILDLACGTGILTLAIAQGFPHAEVVGVELRDEYLGIGRQKQEAAGVSNVTFQLGRAEDFRSDHPFDCVVSSYLAKYADLPRLASAATTWLAPAGLLIMHDFTLPPNQALVGLWRLYFWLLQRAGAPLLPTWREIFYGLPRLIEQTRWLDELPAELKKHGFEEIRREYLTLYGSALLTATAPAPASVPARRPPQRR